jgi:conjugative transfer signal peptidase TraF
MFVTQPLFVLILALASSLLGAAVIAGSTSRKTRKLRTDRLCLFAAAILVFAYAIDALDLRFNFTPSMPLGIYRLTPVPLGGIRRGMFVATCAPLDAAKLGRHRGYLAKGPCPADTELLLKVVAAVAGDVIALSANGVAVNGRSLPHSRPLSFDATGRRLSPWPQGHYPLRRSQLWLYADNDRSWDSRYWGPAPPSNVRARVLPLLTFCERSVVRRLGQPTVQPFGRMPRPWRLVEARSPPLNLP